MFEEGYMRWACGGVLHTWQSPLIRLMPREKTKVGYERVSALGRKNNIRKYIVRRVGRSQTCSTLEIETFAGARDNEPAIGSLIWIIIYYSAIQEPFVRVHWQHPRASAAPTPTGLINNQSLTLFHSLTHSSFDTLETICVLPALACSKHIRAPN